MLSFIRRMIVHRSAAGALLLGTAFAGCAAQAATYTMYRDPGCGCCLEWAEHVEQSASHSDDGHHVTSIDSADMAAIKQANGVPRALWSCHTTLVDGYVIEGHVPAADIARLLAERPKGVTGLAVPGMPLGSPGMEASGRMQPYQVIAFGPAGVSVFSTYN